MPNISNSFLSFARHRLLNGSVSSVSLALLFVFWVADIRPANAESGRFVRLRNTTISTPAKELIVPQLKAQSAPSLVSGLFIIQLESVLSEADEKELNALGGELLRAVPDRAYLVRFTKVELSKVQAFPWVRWLGAYHAEYKLHSTLRAYLPQPAPLPRPQAVEVRVILAPHLRRGELIENRFTLRGLKTLNRGAFGSLLQGWVGAEQLESLTTSPAVLWIEPAPSPKLYDEVSSEIVVGAWEERGGALQQLGFDGDGVLVAVADSGLHNGVAGDMHPDLFGRVDAFFYYGKLESAADEHSHGTHCAGIIAGDGTVGEVDEDGFYYGIGVAPKARIVAQRIFDGEGGYEPPENLADLVRDATQSGAVIGSNSWGDDTHGAYDSNAMLFDALVRDALAFHDQTPGRKDVPYILEFSAGNAGEAGEQTIGSPAVGKNVIATGASGSDRPDMFGYSDGPDSMATFSSRGPCADGRIKPDLVAPGTWIASLQSESATDENAWMPISEYYQFQGGTSQAGPHVSGAAAIFVQYYRQTHLGKTPSPALVKAALINSAVDMDDSYDTGPIPNNDEGWGRLDLTQLIGSSTQFELIEQTNRLVQGSVFEHRVVISTQDNPLKITLTYTDVPGFPAVARALVNDLDLEVISPTGVVYHGNQFEEGESIPFAIGFDDLNNVEGVHLFQPERGEYIVRIIARFIAEDALRETPNIRDQDFALVISGDLPLPGVGVIAFDRPAYTAPGRIQLKLIDFDLALKPTQSITLSSDSQPAGFNVVLQAYGDRGVFTGSVSVVSTPVVADGKIHIKNGDAITATYYDAVPDSAVESRAKADLIPPIASGLATTNRYGREQITWFTDEPSMTRLRYGINGVLTVTLTNMIYTTDHEFAIPTTGPGITYSFEMELTDLAGNSTILRNGTKPFSFVSKSAATILLVNNYVHTFEDESEDLSVTEYTDALDQIGVSYEVFDATNDRLPKLDDLLPFRVVVWRINDSIYNTLAGPSTTINSATERNLTNYLARGGSLLMTSAEILERNPSANFVSNVLHVEHFEPDPLFGIGGCTDCDQNFGIPYILGYDLESITTGIEIALDWSRFPLLDLIIAEIGPDVGDTFTASTNATPILFEPLAGRTVGLKYPRTGADSLSRVIFASFALEAIPMDGLAPNNRVNLLQNFIRFLAPGVNGLASISLDRSAYAIPDLATIEVADSQLIGLMSTTVRVYSDTQVTGVDLKLKPTVQPGLFRGYVSLIPTNAVVGSIAPTLKVKDGDLVWGEYTQVSGDTLVQAIAEIDGTAARISAIEVEPDYTSAVISWNTSEATDALVQYGESKLLGFGAFAASMDSAHYVTVNDLQPDHTYYFRVVSRDQASNPTQDDNDGKFYTFRTLKPLQTPVFLDFENGAEGWTVEMLEDLGESGDTEWTLGIPNNSLLLGAHSGTNAWGSNLNEIATTMVSSDLVSPVIELIGGNTATLRFWTAYDFTAEATIESAELWILTNKAPAQIIAATYYDLAANWEEEVIDLTPYVGQIIQLVWHYLLIDISDEINPHPGWLVDDISIEVSTIYRGKIMVTNNLAQASFELKGAETIRGEGQSWTSPKLLAGTYVTTWSPVDYYITPKPQTNLLSTNTLTLAGIYTFPDINQNRISDIWEAHEFGSVAPDRTVHSDSDADGQSDYAEFIAGTDPNSPESRLTLGLPEMIDGGRLQFQWNAIPGKNYRIRSSTNLKTWNDLPWVRPNTMTGALIVPNVSGIPAQWFQLEVHP